MALFDNYCSACGKLIPTYAIDRSGNVPKVYCNSVCETEFSKASKMTDFKVFIQERKSIGTEEINARIAQKHWQNREPVREEISI